MAAICCYPANTFGLLSSQHSGVHALGDKGDWGIFLFFISPSPPDLPFGPRGVGKSTWLRSVFSREPFFDLLDHSLQMRLAQNPGDLEAEVGKRKKGSWIVIDEIQKLPFLLDEVHRLIEKNRWNFVLCGSSARKLRKGGTNLLAGRALTRYLDSFASFELGQFYDLNFSLKWGNLPLVYQDKKYSRDILSSYFNTYIREEIKEESIVRSLPPFLRFLNIAGLLNTVRSLMA